MQMIRPKICGVLVDADEAAAFAVEEYVDLYEVRIDMIGDGWESLAARLKRPWIACNRSQSEGGRSRDTEGKRIELLLKASLLGASMVDLELATNGLSKMVALIKEHSTCLLSYHDLEDTPSLENLVDIVDRQLSAGADICKVVTTARKFDDNLRVLQLAGKFPGRGVISFAMGPIGVLSRILCPLAGGAFTYASVGGGKESAPGQVTAAELRAIYGTVQC